MLAIDWGLSTFRAWRVAEDGTILGQLSAARGIRGIPRGQFATVLAELLAPWPQAADEPALLCGMVGSRQGWAEAPYTPCPARVTEIAANLHPVPDRADTFLVPGLSCRNAGTADVIRSEETQILGLLRTVGLGRHTVCLPGTHSKWAQLEGGTITSFRTSMTGEMFGLMRSHSMLATVMPDDPGRDAFGEAYRSAFDAGLDRASAPGGLMHHLFGIRAAALLGDITPPEMAPYLSGLLIGHEIGGLAPASGLVHLVGAPGLVARYARALERRGLTARCHGEETSAHGLIAIARAHGMIGGAA